jgi:antitoxin component YwqK of YwqJK toxin-antitoxin module
MMNCRYVLSFLLIFSLYFNANAQVKPVYFYGDQITTDKDKATSYAIYGKLSTEDLWMFKRYDLDNNLIQTGSYSDAALTTPHGKFIFYMDLALFNKTHETNFRLNGKPRFISQQGTFVNGEEDGKWLVFYPDGNVLSAQDYVNGKLHGEFVAYDKFGRIEMQGSFVDGAKDGEWFIEGGKRKQIYEKGILKSTTNVEKPKKVKN